MFRYGIFSLHKYINSVMDLASSSRKNILFNRLWVLPFFMLHVTDHYLMACTFICFYKGRNYFWLFNFVRNVFNMFNIRPCNFINHIDIRYTRSFIFFFTCIIRFFRFFVFILSKSLDWRSLLLTLQSLFFLWLTLILI